MISQFGKLWRVLVVPILLFAAAAIPVVVARGLVSAPPLASQVAPLWLSLGEDALEWALFLGVFLAAVLQLPISIPRILRFCRARKAPLVIADLWKVVQREKREILLWTGLGGREAVDFTW